jgi:inhibitor of KinA sporulation pathway (predicted exonuclease)
MGIDIMLDLETLGLGDNVVIIQISAVVFNIKSGDILEVFDEYINPQDSVKRGFKIESSTVEWWFSQSEEVFQNVFVKSLNSKNTIDKVLLNFNTWISKIKEEQKVNNKYNINMWGNGILADNKWLRQAYKLCNIEPCWKFYEDKDVRTLLELGRRLFSYEMLKFEGTKHNALDDCKHQIKYCCEIYNKMNKN